MKKIVVLVFAAALGALSTLAFARDDDGPWKVVFTESTAGALKTAVKKQRDGFWTSKQLARPLNRLAEQGFHAVHIMTAGDRLLIFAKK